MSKQSYQSCKNDQVSIDKTKVEIAEITRDIRDLRKLLAIADRLQRKAQKVQKTVEDLENQVKGAFEQAKEKTAADKQQSRD